MRYRFPLVAAAVGLTATIGAVAPAAVASAVQPSSSSSCPAFSTTEDTHHGITLLTANINPFQVELTAILGKQAANRYIVDNIYDGHGHLLGTFKGWADSDGVFVAVIPYFGAPRGKYHLTVNVLKQPTSSKHRPKHNVITTFWETFTVCDPQWEGQQP
jgi:hypothetical protein